MCTMQLANRSFDDETLDITGGVSVCVRVFFEICSRCDGVFVVRESAWGGPEQHLPCAYSNYLESVRDIYFFSCSETGRTFTTVSCECTPLLCILVRLQLAGDPHRVGSSCNNKRVGGGGGRGWGARAPLVPFLGLVEDDADDVERRAVMTWNARLCLVLAHRPAVDPRTTKYLWRGRGAPSALVPGRTRGRRRFCSRGRR